MSETRRPAPPTPEHNYHPNYRPDIDGLRALAILPVVAYHSYPHSFPGGFVGVDVFFVISGFLISRIIFQSLRDGDFSFREFYAHRVRRIFPALLVVLAACFAFGWFALLPEEFQQLGKHIAASAGFVQNFALWREAGYFDTPSDLKPLLHLWSLAVEEQFYVIYPLLIWAVWRARLHALASVAVLGIVSFGLNLYGIRQDAAGTFFLPHTRYWELLAGATLAWHHHFGTRDYYAGLKRVIFHPVFFRLAPAADRQNAIAANIVGALGLCLILISIFALNRSVPYPGGWAVLPVAGAFLVILAGRAAWVNARILAWRPLVYIGLISYPLYLWHWPLLSFAHILEESRIVALVLSFLFAWLTYRLIERPVRFGAKSWRKIVVLCALMTVLGYVGYNTFSRDGLPFRTPVRHWVAFDRENFKFEDGSLHDATCYEAIPLYQGAICKIAKSGPPTVVLLGDSHANALFSGLASATAADPLTNVLNVGEPGHAPFAGIESGKADGGEQERKHHMVEFDLAVAFAEDAPSVRTVIIASRGPLYLSGYLPWNHSGPHDFVVSMPGRPDITNNGEIWRTAMRETLVRLVAKGKQVIFVLDVPDLDFNAKECVEYRPLRFTERKLRSPCALPRKEFEVRNREYRELVASVLKDFPMVKLFDAAAPLCDSQWCWVIKEGKILYRDADHLSVEGSRLVGRQLAKLLVHEPAAVPLTNK